MDKQVVTIEGKEIEISHPERVIWPEAGITKLDYLTAGFRLDAGYLGRSGCRNLSVRFHDRNGSEVFADDRRLISASIVAGASSESAGGQGTGVY